MCICPYASNVSTEMIMPTFRYLWHFQRICRLYAVICLSLCKWLCHSLCLQSHLLRIHDVYIHSILSLHSLNFINNSRIASLHRPVHLLNSPDLFLGARFRPTAWLRRVISRSWIALLNFSIRSANYSIIIVPCFLSLIVFQCYPILPFRNVAQSSTGRSSLASLFLDQPVLH